MIIKEKLMLNRDYSLINKSCYSCKQFTHTVEECPKLHFVPNIERIIKQHTFPSTNQRSAFVRKERKTLHALFSRMRCKKAQRSFQIMTKRKSVVLEESDSSSDSKEKINDVPEEDSFGESQESFRKKREDFLLNQYKTSKTDGSKTSKDESSENPFINPESNGQDPKGGFSPKVMLEHQKSNPDQNSKNIIMVKKFSAPENRQVIVCDEIEIDRVCEFQIYFPMFNIEKIIESYGKTLQLEREINRKYLKRYREFKKYTFFQNIILEKFWKEAKIRKKKRKENATKCSLARKGTMKKKHPSMIIRRQTLNQNSSPLTKKSFFGTNNAKTEITSFTDLIHTLISQKNISKKTQK